MSNRMLQPTQPARRAVGDLDARVLAAIDLGRIQPRRRRQGCDRPEALHDEFGAGGANRGLRWNRGLRQGSRRGVEGRLGRCRNWGRRQRYCERGRQRGCRRRCRRCGRGRQSGRRKRSRRGGRGGSGEERHLCVGGGRKRFRIDGGQRVGLGRFPERGGAAALTETENAIAGGEDVRFDAGVVDFFESFAGVADEREEAAFHFGG